MAKKRYDKVSQMVQDVAESKEFSEAFEQRLTSRQLVKQLIILRASKGLSQEDIATALGCTQSKVSKLEAMEDGELRMEDLVGYASAVGMQMQFVFCEKEMTLADKVKCQFFETKTLMERLTNMANVDPVIAKGIAGFFNEACVNFVMMLVNNAKTLPPEAHDDYPLVRLLALAESKHACKEKSVADQSVVTSASQANQETIHA